MHRRNALVVALVALGVSGLAWLLPGEEPTEPAVALTAPAPRAAPAPRRIRAKRVVPAPPAAAPAAPVEEPAEDGPIEVACAVGRGLEGRDHVVTVEDPDAPTGVRLQQGSYDGSTLTLTVPSSASQGMLVFPGSSEPSVPFTWSRGEDGEPACTLAGVLPPPADAGLFGKVRGAANLPDGSVFLEGCAASDEPVDDDGAFFAVTSAGECRMRAWRQAGSLRIPGPWVSVVAVGGADTAVELSVPTFAPAGMGIGFNSPGSDGLVVAEVHADTPAIRAGLGVGDRITRIDGVPTEGMDADGFLQHGLGPEGSQVRLEGTTADGESFEVTLTRRAIDPT